MASYIPWDRPMRQIPSSTPLTLTELQGYVGGFIRFIELSCGDVMVVNEAGPAFAPVNHTASGLACQTIHGDVVLCSPEEIA